MCFQNEIEKEKRTTVVMLWSKGHRRTASVREQQRKEIFVCRIVTAGLP